MGVPSMNVVEADGAPRSVAGNIAEVEDDRRGEMVVELPLEGSTRAADFMEADMIVPTTEERQGRGWICRMDG
ncbi:hypothetical protein TRIUR3_15098 [Triticum urartu]|uniref:Uncharacterized protein n=1 Tax=Triticum urartu TaxID=4572 RepID=M7Y5Z1_TRIUA|nr:hypothetical protein TRIUR3_15098 [Triticum urartu]